MSEGRVEALYSRIKEMTVDFQIRPGERINEGALARDLQASRTPLREALNRLVTERLIEFRPSKGFFCRDLDAGSIFELYELREIIEESAVRRACERGADTEIQSLKSALFDKGLDYQGKTVREVTDQDESFHLGIARLSRNEELVHQLERINERIRFIRWIDMAAHVAKTRNEHKLIMQAVEDRDADRAAAIMRSHIEKRVDQIVAAVKEGYSSLYVAGAEELFERRIDPPEVDA